MEKITLTVNEVAELIGVSIGTIYTMARLSEILTKRFVEEFCFTEGLLKTGFVMKQLKGWREINEPIISDTRNL